MIQTYKTHCEHCGEEVEHQVANFADEDEIIIDFISGMEFECDCGEITYVEIEKHLTREV